MDSIEQILIYYFPLYVPLNFSKLSSYNQLISCDTFLTRYIAPINKPIKLEHQSLTRLEMASSLVRYVSLIPFEAGLIPLIPCLQD